MNTRILALSVLVCGALAASSSAQVYVDLPAGSWVNDVTPDGEVVVGTWNFGDGFIWRWQEEPAPTVILGGDVVGVSDDGTIVCGNYFDAGLNASVAATWTAAGGWQVLPFLPGAPCDFFYSSAYDISGDGGSVVGLGWNGCSAEGFLWTQAAGTQSLQVLANGSNRCSAISGDGSTMGGFAQGSFNRTPAYWDASTAGFVLDPSFQGEVYGFNEDGSKSVGTLYFSGNTYDAFVRDASSGTVTNLGKLASNWAGNATDISEDGNTIVGYDTNGLARRAWVWTSTDGMISVDDRLAALGITGADDAFVCRAVSDDGNVIVGGGLDGGGPFGFGGFILSLTDLAWSDLGDGLAGTGGLVPELSGLGTLAPGSSVTLALTDARPNSGTYLVLGLTALNAPFKGGVLVPDADLVIGPVNTDATGELTLHFTWPLSAPSGFDTWWQEWILDPNGPVGFAASNGLLGTTP